MKWCTPVWGSLVCVEGGFPPPSWPTVHQKRAQHAECVPLTPHECAWHTEPVLLPWGSLVPFGSVPFRSIQLSSVVRSPPVHPGVRNAPSPCARDTARATPRAPAHATQRARHPEPLRTHTQPGHGTPRTPIQHQTPRWFNSSHRKSRETPVASIVELAEVGTPAPSRHKRGNPHGHSAARGPPCCVTHLAGGDGGSLLRRLELVDGRDRLHQGFAELVRLRLGQGGELARGAPGAQPAGVLGDGSPLLCNAPTRHSPLRCRVGVVRLVVGCACHACVPPPTATGAARCVARVPYPWTARAHRLGVSRALGRVRAARDARRQFPATGTG